MKKKIKKSISKRFKITKTGKVMRGRQFAGHLRRNKSKSQIRRFNRPATLKGKFARKVREAM